MNFLYLIIIYFYVHTIAGVTPSNPDTQCEVDITGIFISEEEIQVTLVSNYTATCSYSVVVNDLTNHCDCSQNSELICQQMKEKKANQDTLTFPLCTTPDPASNLSIRIKPSGLEYFQYQIWLNTMKETGI